MTEELSTRLKLLEDLPDDPPRSPLEPYRDLILRWRRKGKTYRRISELLYEHCGLTVKYGPLYRFVHRRSRPRKAKEESVTLPTKASHTVSRVSPNRSTQEYSREEIAAMREAVRIARNAPTQTATSSQKIFVYDSTKPITKE